MDWHIVREFVQAAAAFAALARLAYFHLTRQFRALACYLGLLSLSHVLAGGLSRQSVTYFWYYFALTPLESVAGIFAVRELIALIFADYPGIRTVGRWALYAGVLLSVGVSLALTNWFSYAGPEPRIKWGLFYMEAAERSITFSLAVAIVAILFALSKYPLNLGRNTYLSCAFFSAIFLTDAARLLIDSSQRLLFYELAESVSAISISLCLFAWGFLLRAQTAPAPRIAFPTAHEDRLLHQLESLNSLMIRTARR
jgi:hypothetical protein